MYAWEVGFVNFFIVGKPKTNTKKTKIFFWFCLFCSFF